MRYYQQSPSDVLRDLSTDQQTGLTSSQVADRLEAYGHNVLEQKAGIPWWKLFLQQFASPLMVVLLAATIVSSLIGDTHGGIMIMIIVCMNAIIGFIQEYNAEKSIESLKEMMSLHSTVIRDGVTASIDSSMLVPGDIVVVDEGDKIPADGYLLSLNNLETAEAALTGESLPVSKSLDVIDRDVTLGDQRNMVFSGTTVVKGFATYVVTSTGMQTEIGKIASLIDDIDNTTTHLQKKLARLSKKIGIGVLVICVIVFLSYYMGHNLDLSSAFLASVALAVAAIPEGLPAVVTIALSLGVKRMVRKDALMRKLPSVETLGSVNVICSDKTGTLTKNEMTVTHVYVDGNSIAVTGAGYRPEGSFERESSSLEQLLKIGVLCNHASITDESTIIGDPTEGCLLVSAQKAGYNHESFSEYRYMDEIPFDSERKMMSSIYSCDDKYETMIKGAPESLLPRATMILVDGEVRPLTDDDKTLITDQVTSYAQDAMRVLAFAYKINDTLDKEHAEQDIIWVGLQAMIDPAREEVKDAIDVCREAGVRVVMITGDNLQTAQAIAATLGITGQAMTGNDLETIDDDELLKVIDEYGVFARVNPSHKQRLVMLLQQQGNIVAMTGDGVNDAPALKQSDIGVAMGITGTDVSKEASDMILLDDNFTTIVSAIEEGRGIYDNIEKFVNFLLSTNVAEVLILFIMSMMGLPLPLLAIHLLWINLVTDGLPALALGIDPIDKNIMKRKPLHTKHHIIDARMVRSIVMISLLITAVVVYFYLQWYQVDLSMARTGVMILLVGLEIMRVQMIRSDYNIGILSNKRLVGALILSILLVLMIIYTPMAQFFKTTAPSAAMWSDVGVLLLVTSILGLALDYVMDRWHARRAD